MIFTGADKKKYIKACEKALGGDRVTVTLLASYVERRITTVT